MTYTPKQITAHKATILEGIATGKSLRAICADQGMPNRETVRVWLTEDNEFSGQYARAREEQADFYADEIIEIADTEADPAKARNRISARQWKASKLQPKKYGDKLDLNHTGTVQTMSEEQVAARISELLRKAGAGDALGAPGVAGKEAAT